MRWPIIVSGAAGVLSAAALSVAISAAPILPWSSDEAPNWFDRSDPQSEGVREFLQTATAEQQSALADGLITEDEYAVAFEAHLDCLERAGVPHDEPFFDASEQRWFARIGPVQPTERQTLSDQLNGCYDQHLAVVAFVWGMQLGGDSLDLQQ